MMEKMIVEYNKLKELISLTESSKNDLNKLITYRETPGDMLLLSPDYVKIKLHMYRTKPHEKIVFAKAIMVVEMSDKIREKYFIDVKEEVRKVNQYARKLLTTYPEEDIAVYLKQKQEEEDRLNLILPDDDGPIEPKSDNSVLGSGNITEGDIKIIK